MTKTENVYCVCLLEKDRKIYSKTGDDRDRKCVCVCVCVCVYVCVYVCVH